MRIVLKNCTFLIDKQCIERRFFKKLDFLSSINNLEWKEYILSPQIPTIAHPWCDGCDGHSTSTKFLWSGRQEPTLKVFRRKFHTYIHLDYVRVEFLFCIIIIIIIKVIITRYSTMSTSLKELVIRSNNQPSKVLH